MVVSARCHKTWKIPQRLIRVNEAIQTEKYQRMRKVNVLKFSGRSVTAKTWLNLTDNATVQALGDFYSQINHIVQSYNSHNVIFLL